MDPVAEQQLDLVGEGATAPDPNTGTEDLGDPVVVLPKTKAAKAPAQQPAELMVEVMCPVRVGAAVWLQNGAILRSGETATITASEAQVLTDSGVVVYVRG